MPETEILTFRPATTADLDDIVRLLANDPLGSQREQFSQPLPEAYVRAFEAIDADPNNELIVASAGVVIGVMQLTYLPSLTYQGSWRMQIEGVRIAEEWRSQGVGRKMFEWAIARARARGCRLVQLTSDKKRPDALRFYGSLGFAASHVGFKLRLN